MCSQVTSSLHCAMTGSPTSTQNQDTVSHSWWDVWWRQTLQSGQANQWQSSGLDIVDVVRHVPYLIYRNRGNLCKCSFKCWHVAKDLVTMSKETLVICRSAGKVKSHNIFLQAWLNPFLCCHHWWGSLSPTSSLVPTGLSPMAWTIFVWGGIEEGESSFF